MTWQEELAMFGRLTDGYWLKCPHCGHKHIGSDHLDGGDDSDIVTCDKCGKEFKAVAHFSVDYESRLIEEKGS